MPHDPIKAYCESVCAMIRCKPCHAAVTAELTNHMTDHADHLIAKGAGPDDAKGQAAAAMGDPREIGAALDKLHNPWFPGLSVLFFYLGILALVAAFIVGIQSDFSEVRFAPFASHAALVLRQEEYDRRLVTVIAEGRATGGGRVGPYFFSPSGSAALVRIDTDYRGAPLDAPEYELWMVFSSLCPTFWLDALSTDTTVWSAAGEELQTSCYPLPEQGFSRRFYRVKTVLSDPALRRFTIGGGEGVNLSYAVTLEEVAAP